MPAIYAKSGSNIWYDLDHTGSVLILKSVLFRYNCSLAKPRTAKSTWRRMSIHHLPGSNISRDLDHTGSALIPKSVLFRHYCSLAKITAANST